MGPTFFNERATGKKRERRAKLANKTSAQLARTLRTPRLFGCLWLAFEYVRDLRCMPCGRAASRFNVELHQLLGSRRRTMPRACMLSIVGNMRAAMSSAIGYLCLCAFSACVRKAWTAYLCA
jgi:hypothetical protein